MCIATNYVNDIRLKISDIKQIVKDYKAELTNLHHALSNVDLELTDLDHALLHRKVLKIPANVLIKITIKVSEIQVKRLEIKNNIELMENIKPFIHNMDNVFVPNKTVEQIEKQKDIQCKRRYQPRTTVLAEFNIKFNQ